MAKKFKILPKNFYERDTVIVARDLLGKLLVHVIDDTILVGRIVETEAYCGPIDPASHAYRGITERTKALFGPPGHAYIYFIYGNHFSLNAVAHTKDAAGGVLIRAVEPLEGIEFMQQQRGMQTIKNLTNGPGKLAQAFAIDKKLYGHDLTHEGPLMIGEQTEPYKFVIQESPRIGISCATDKHWRFYVANNPFVSHTRITEKK